MSKAINSSPNQNNQQSNDEGTQQGSAAKWLINHIIKSEMVLFHDQHNEAYAATNGNGSRIIRLESSEFKKWLHYFYWSKTKEPLPRDTDARVISMLVARACFEGPLHRLNVRHVKQGNTLWYDLGNGQAVHITIDGWEIISNPPILFRRFQHQETQVLPVRDGDLGLLASYLNIPDESDDWLLFLVNLIAAFVPGFPHPLLILYGSQGAGKSTPMRLMKKLLDPSGIGALPLPSDPLEFARTASHHAFMFFDNLSNLSAKMSDALARVSTGDGFSKRKLYTDDDDFFNVIQRPIALNGINQVIVKPDLLDRSILIKLERITPEKRIAEAEYWEAFEHDKPYLLGAIFDVLTKTLSIFSTVELDKAPRMADFARWSCAIAEAAGYTRQAFLDAYQRNIDRQNEEALEASPVAKAVIMLMKTTDEWGGSPAELLSRLNNVVFTLGLSSSPLWPKAPEWMTRRLKEVEVNLAVIGIHVEEVRTNDGRLLSITKELTDIPDFESGIDYVSSDSSDSK